MAFRIKALRRLRCCGLPVFCWGGAGASALAKFLPPSCRPPLLLSCGRLAWQHHGGGAAHPHPAGLRNDAPLCVAATVRRARPHPARPRPSRVRHQPTLADGKQLAAVLRIKPLRHLHCCALPVFCLGGVGASGKRQRLSLSNATARTDVRLAVTR